MNRMDKIKQEFLEQFTDKLKEEKVDISVESAFDILISADPSRNKKNVRWLIETYLNDGFLWEDIQSGHLSKVHETLNTFIRNKNKLDILDRSINRYESIADMWKMVKQYAEDKTGKEIKRADHDKAMAESEVVIDNDDIRIVIPTTEYASQFHGRGTRWCTAADNNNMFWRYAKKAPLFIITLKESGDKLQLWKNNNDIQFMDSNDKTVSKEYIAQNWNLLKDIIKYTGTLRFVPDMTSDGVSLITPELCKTACEQDGRALYHIPEKLKTPELCRLAVQQNGEALEYVPDTLMTSELCKIAVEQDGSALHLVPDMTTEGVSLRTPELCELAVRKDGLALGRVPKEYKTTELCKLAVEQSGAALGYVPGKLMTSELCEIAVKQDGKALVFVPGMTFHGIVLKTPELCKIACAQNGMALRYVPNEFITPELCRLAVKQNGCALKFVPNMTSDGVSLRTPELCRIACEQDGLALDVIPMEIRKSELCRIACKQNGLALEFVPDRLKSPEICEIAVKKNGKAFEFVPERYKTYNLRKLSRIKNESIIPFDIYKESIDTFQDCFRVSSPDNQISVRPR